jgi:hypothetical protein
MILLVTKFYSGDQKEEMGGTCGMYGEEEKGIQGFGWKI